MKEYELPNVGDSRKSFYGKAIVIEEGNVIKLKSYNTIVAQIIDGKLSINGTYSPTTLRHIKSFIMFFGFESGTKSDIIKMYLKEEC